METSAVLYEFDTRDTTQNVEDLLRDIATFIAEKRLFPLLINVVFHEGCWYAQVYV